MSVPRFLTRRETNERRPRGRKVRTETESPNAEVRAAIDTFYRRTRMCVVGFGLAHLAVLLLFVIAAVARLQQSP